jgi:hypothetical protein
MVFDNEWVIDYSASKKITSLIDAVNNSVDNYGKLAERIAP